MMIVSGEEQVHRWHDREPLRGLVDDIVHVVRDIAGLQVRLRVGIILLWWSCACAGLPERLWELGSNTREIKVGGRYRVLQARVAKVVHVGFERVDLGRGGAVRLELVDV